MVIVTAKWCEHEMKVYKIPTQNSFCFLHSSIGSVAIVKKRKISFTGFCWFNNSALEEDIEVIFGRDTTWNEGFKLANLSNLGEMHLKIFLRIFCIFGFFKNAQKRMEFLRIFWRPVPHNMSIANLFSYLHQPSISTQSASNLQLKCWYNFTPLCYTMLHYTILYYTILYYTILYCTLTRLLL